MMNAEKDVNPMTMRHVVVQAKPDLSAEEAVEWMRAWHSAGPALERVRRAR